MKLLGAKADKCSIKPEFDVSKYNERALLDWFGQGYPFQTEIKMAISHAQ